MQATEADPRISDRRARLAGIVAVWLAILLSALAIPFANGANVGVFLGLFLSALAAHAVMLRIHARRPFLNRRWIMTGVAVLLAVAVAAPPEGSRDLWSYAMYGHIVAHYHRNPYQNQPENFASDPILNRVDPHWRETKSVYGPVFIGLAAAGSALAGRPAGNNRLVFQTMAALALLLCLFLLYKSGADAGTLAFLGLNPVVIVSIVNGGHNDLLVGAALLGGVLAVRNKRPILAGAVVGLGSLVKIVGILALPAVFIWLWRRQGRRAAIKGGAAGIITIAAGYLAAGGAVALSPLAKMTDQFTRASIWRALRPFVAGAHPVILPASLVLVLLISYFKGRAHEDALPILVTASVLVYLLAAPYVLPWYSGWALPVAALAWKSRTAWVAVLQSAGLLLVSIDRPALPQYWVHSVLQGASTVALPLFEAAALAALLFSVVRARRLSHARIP